MVVAVIDEVVGDGVSMLGIEMLEKGLGCLLLLVAELFDEALCLNFPKTAYLAQVEVRCDRLDGVELIGTNGSLSRLTIRCADGDIDPVVPDP
jgi:hypothetical protein